MICTPVVVSGARRLPTMPRQSSSIPTSRRSTSDWPSLGSWRETCPATAPPVPGCGAVQADRRFHRRRSRGLRVQPRRRGGRRSDRALIQVSERSTRWVASNERDVGAVLFRAGRLEEALERFAHTHKVCRAPRLGLALSGDDPQRAGSYERSPPVSPAGRSVDRRGRQGGVGNGKGSHALDEPDRKADDLASPPRGRAMIRFGPVFPNDPFAH